MDISVFGPVPAAPSKTAGSLKPAESSLEKVMEDFAEVLGAYSPKGNVPSGVLVKEDAKDVKGNGVSENKEASLKERAVHEDDRDSSGEEAGGGQMQAQVNSLPVLLSQRIDIPDPLASPNADAPTDTPVAASVAVDMSTDTQTALPVTAPSTTFRNQRLLSNNSLGDGKWCWADVRGILAEAPSLGPAPDRFNQGAEDKIIGSAMAPAASPNGLAARQARGKEDSQTPVPDLPRPQATTASMANALNAPSATFRNQRLLSNDSLGDGKWRWAWAAHKAGEPDEAAGISEDPKDVDSKDAFAGNAYHKDQPLKTGRVWIEGKIPQPQAETSSTLQPRDAVLLSKDNADGIGRDADGCKAAVKPAPDRVNRGQADTPLPLTDAKENPVGGKALISFEKAALPFHADGITDSSQAAMPRVIYEGVDHGVSLSVLRNGKEVSVSLHPENLGRLHIRVIDGESGVAAKIVVENSVVKQILDADAVRLREIFAGQGLKLGGYSVEVGSFGPSMEGRENGGGFLAFGSSGGGSWAYPGGGRAEPEAGNGYAGIPRDSGPKAQGLPQTDYPGKAGGKRYSGIDLFI